MKVAFFGVAARLGGAVLLAIVAGCAVPLGTSSTGISAHISRPVLESPNDLLPPPTSALYTYVLAPNGEFSSDAGMRARDALTSLLVETQTRPVASGKQPSDIAKTALNQFIVPAKKVSGDQAVGIEDFDFQLSERYLGSFRESLVLESELRARLSNRGPFLIGARRPIGEIVIVSVQGAKILAPEEPILLVDLTDLHPKAVHEAVQAYKQAVLVPPDSSQVVSVTLARVKSMAIELDGAIKRVLDAKTRFVEVATK